MKKVININFQGRVIPIEETAYEILKQYVDSLRRYFINEEGREEIINDIESRIAELFGETLKKGGTCITDEDVKAVISSIGRPEDFDGDEEKVKSRVYEESGNNKNYTYTKAERFYRSENDKIVAGVCGGLAAYFGIDPIIVRILFVVFSFGFGFGFIAYIVLWIAVPSTASTVIGSARKRLLRDPEDKLIGGVCKGLSYYFGVNVWIPRILFLIPFFSFFFRWAHWGILNYPNFLSVSFSPGATLIYIILWIVLPEAKSTSDRLEMKGEKVDINSIKNNITNEMKGVGERVTKFGQEAADFAKQTGQQFSTKSKQFSGEVAQTARKSGRGLGNVLALLIKIFVYFIVGCVLFAVVCGLFAFGVVMIGLLPLKNYILNGGWETVFAWGTLLLVWIPVIAIITGVIRRLAKVKGNSGILRASFWSLWLLGLACGIGLLVSLATDFKYHSTVNEQNISLSDAKTNKLELHADRLGSYYRRYDWLQMEPFANIDEDTAYVNNLHVRIIKADADSFEVKLLKMSDGASREQANELSNEINYNITQKDSMLTLSKGIAITENRKFRNQRVYVTVAVPLGKRILIDGSVANWYGNVHIGFRSDDWNNYGWRNDNDGYDWDHDVEYIMTKDGLKRADGKVKNDDNNNDDNSDDDINQKLEENKRNREELERQRNEMQQKMQQIDSELKRPVDTVPSTPKNGQKQTLKTAAVMQTHASISTILLSKLAI